MLRTWVVRLAASRLTLSGEVLPRPGDAGHFGLSAELAFGADFTRHARHFTGKRVQLIDHRVQRLLQLQNLAADVDGDLLGQVPAGNRGRHLGDIPDLRRQVVGHRVDAVGEVLPRARHPQHLGLAAEPAFRAHLARDAGDLARERVELVDHGVDGVLQLEDLALDVNRDLAGQVAARHRRRHLGDIAHLGRQVGGQQVDVVGQVLPGAGHAGHLRLASQLAFGAHFPRDPRDFTGKRVQLIDHRVQRLLQLQDLAADVDGDLLGQVPAGDRGRDLGDVADLRRQVVGHRVDAVGEVFPCAGHPRHPGLTAKPAFRAHLARDTGNLAGERVELVDHRVDGFLQQEDLAGDVDGDLLREIAARDRGGDVGDVPHLGGQVARHHRFGLAALGVVARPRTLGRDASPRGG